MDEDNILSHVIEYGPSDDHNSQNKENNENPTTQNDENQNAKWQNSFCFWMIGLCDGFGWTVMLSATFDIIKRLNGVSVRSRYLN